jgi:hypothetical protein
LTITLVGDILAADKTLGLSVAEVEKRRARATLGAHLGWQGQEAKVAVVVKVEPDVIARTEKLFGLIEEQSQRWLVGVRCEH